MISQTSQRIPRGKKIKMNEQARVARSASLMNDHNASSPQAENKHTFSTSVDTSILYISLSADPTNPTAATPTGISASPSTAKNWKRSEGQGETHKTCPTQHPTQTFRKNKTYRAELSDFRSIILGHSGVGIAGSRRGGRGNSGGGHGGVAFAVL